VFEIVRLATADLLVVVLEHCLARRAIVERAVLLVLRVGALNDFLLVANLLQAQLRDHRLVVHQGVLALLVALEDEAAVAIGRDALKDLLQLLLLALARLVQSEHVELFRQLHLVAEEKKFGGLLRCEQVLELADGLVGLAHLNEEFVLGFQQLLEALFEC